MSIFNPNKEKKPSKNSYEKFFEDYKVEYEPKASGGLKIKRTYDGVVYVRRCSDKTWKRLKALYAGLFVLAAALFVFSRLASVNVSTYWYGIVAAVLVIMPMLYLIPKLFIYVSAPRQMTVYDWKSVTYHIRIAAFLAVCAMVINVIVALVITIKEKTGGDILCTILTLLSAAALAALYILEFKADYMQIEQQDLMQ